MTPCRLMLGRGMYAVTLHPVAGGAPVTHECSERTAESAARRFAELHPQAAAIVAENLLNPHDSFELAPSLATRRQRREHASLSAEPVAA